MLKGVERLLYRIAKQPSSLVIISSNIIIVDIEILVYKKYSPYSNNYSSLRPRNSLEGSIRILLPLALRFSDIEISF